MAEQANELWLTKVVGLSKNNAETWSKRMEPSWRDNLQPWICLLREDFGMSQERARAAVKKHTRLLSIDTAGARRVVLFLLSTGCSIQTVEEMLWQAPWFLSLAVSELAPKFHWLTSVWGIEAVVQDPHVLTVSLEERLLPRHACARGMCVSLAELAWASDQEFARCIDFSLEEFSHALAAAVVDVELPERPASPTSPTAVSPSVLSFEQLGTSHLYQGPSRHKHEGLAVKVHSGATIQDRYAIARGGGPAGSPGALSDCMRAKIWAPFASHGGEQSRAIRSAATDQATDSAASSRLHVIRVPNTW